MKDAACVPAFIHCVWQLWLDIHDHLFSTFSSLFLSTLLLILRRKGNEAFQGRLDSKVKNSDTFSVLASSFSITDWECRNYGEGETLLGWHTVPLDHILNIRDYFFKESAIWQKMITYLCGVNIRVTWSDHRLIPVWSLKRRKSIRKKLKERKLAFIPNFRVLSKLSLNSPQISYIADWGPLPDTCRIT